MEITEDTSESSLFRAICLAAAPVEHEDADLVLAALRARGWSIDIRGHQRAGEMVITLKKGV